MRNYESQSSHYHFGLMPGKDILLVQSMLLHFSLVYCTVIHKIFILKTAHSPTSVL